MIERMNMEAGTGIAKSAEDETMLMLGACLDDSVKWVTLPEEVGGGQAHVIGIEQVQCPLCEIPHIVNNLKLNKIIKGKRLHVCECGRHNKFAFNLVKEE